MELAKHKSHAQEVFRIEIDALHAVAANLDGHFDAAVEAILQSTGRVVIIGMGKSGLIGRKIIATLASTGTPSFFVHPGEAIHGDLGQITADDVAILISNSGETEEMLQLLPYFEDTGNITIAMTGNPQSTLAQHAKFHLNIAVPQEACPHRLAPTSSTTATLVMGDALAVALMSARNFQPENFARFHPGGSLGRRLLTQVRHVMHHKNLPKISADTSIMQVIHRLSEGRLGLVIVDEGAGIITDGDLRRAMENFGSQIFDRQAQDIMTANPISIAPNLRLTDAESLMTQKKITSLLVKEDYQVVGVIQIYDL